MTSRQLRAKIFQPTRMRGRIEKRVNMAKKHHKYTHSTIEHHDDGSHTTTHHHEDGKSHKKYTSADHDSLLDGLIDKTTAPTHVIEASEATSVGGINSALRLP